MITPAFDLSGRVAIVTGAGSATGIGFACARLLVDLGAKALITSTTDRIHDRRRELIAAGLDERHIHSVVEDLTNPHAPQILVDEATSHFGSLDILVNNAGMTSVLTPGQSGSIDDISTAQWEETLQRNATTAFAMCKAAVPHMRTARYGRIINITSVTGPVMAMRNEVAYAAAKAAMVGMTRALAVDLAHHGISVNAVAPGWIATGSSNEHEQQQGKATPMRRNGRPEEIAGAVAWLSSASAGYITGQVLTVDGGNSIAEERS